MDFTQLYNQLVEDFNLKDLKEEDREEMLLEVSKTIQKQFLLDTYDLLGKEKFDALQASANMGEEFYATTLKHLVPNYEEVFQSARTKVVNAFKSA
ncbi:MAG: hypothetical protein WCT07_01340 [Candidatus Paceibacterota bacterium]